MSVLGHRSANMAMTYTRISDSEVRRQCEIALTNGSRIAGPAEDAPCIDVNRWESHPTNVRTLSEHVSRFDLDLIPSLRGRRNDAATTGEGPQAITKSTPSLIAYERPTPAAVRSQRPQNEPAAS